MDNKESLNSSMRRRYVVALSALVMATALLSGACKPWTHDAEWANPQLKGTKDFHGTVVINRGSSTLCKACHGSELKGLGEIPGCYKCHFGPEGSRSPSGSSWNHGMAQHENLRAEEPMCNTCHELYRSNGLAPNTCHDCHSISPETHPLGQSWLDKKSPDFHGKSTLDCSTCHDLKTKCSTCHFGATGSQSPSGSGWSHGTTPHNQLASSEAVCSKCHTLDRSYGNGPATCHDCHGTPPSHVLGEPWLNQKSPQFHGKSTLNCASCHDLKTKCSNCHFGATGSQSPSGSGWSHGTTPHNQLESSGAVCNICHELDRGYGNGPATCHDCHVKPPHVLGQSWLDQKSSQFHGRSTLDCNSCHDPNTECASCHFGASGSKSPSSGWLHGTTPHNQLASSEAVCNKCHKLDRSYGNGPATCHDCHSGVGGGGSGGGHVLGKPWLDPKSAQFHGSSTLNCSSCHDLNTKCATCHFGATGRKAPVGSTWGHGTTPHNQLASSEAVCSKCHTLERSYGNGPATCHDCHAQQTHVLGKPWLDPKSSQFHGKSTIDCSTCHNTATECSSCHFGASGNKAPSGSGWSHGTTPHNQMASSEAVCNQCHTLERSYGNGPATCHDCHAQQTHVLGKPWLDPKSAQFHGDSSLNCSTCHNTATECSSCHFGASGNKAPSGSGWSHGTTPHNQMASSEAVCNQCHTLERSYGNGPATCHDCHAQQTHVLGKPWLDPKSAQFHGDSSLNCSTCHNTATECSSCHFGASGNKAPSGSGWSHGTTPHNQMASSEAVCNQCHTLERSYGNGPATCHDCHAQQTHVLGKPWLDPKSAQFHGDSSLNCSSCHNTSTECSTCHFGPTGRKAPVGSSWSHGSSSHKSMESYQAVCNKCHTLERSYGHGPSSCHDCHGDGD